MNEIKPIQRRFGCIVTSLDEGSDLTPATKLEVIRGWKSATEKIRVFGTPVQEEQGITNAKAKAGHPTLRAMVEDHVKGIRSQGPLVIAAPTIQIAPVCEELSEWAAKKNMGLAWVFNAANGTVWGVSPTVAKVLADEIPETVLFKGTEWSSWLDKWVTKYMQPHRRFSADQFSIAVPLPENEPEEPKKSCKKQKKRPS